MSSVSEMFRAADRMSILRGHAASGMRLLWIGVLLGLGLLAAWPAAVAEARGARACVKDCKKQKSACIRDAKAERKVEQRACASLGPAKEQKACKKVERNRFKLNKRECKNLFSEVCRRCCKDGGVTCTLGPGLCGNEVLNQGEECDPPGLQAQCAVGAVCGASCSCSVEPLAPQVTTTTAVLATTTTEPPVPTTTLSPGSTTTTSSVAATTTTSVGATTTTTSSVAATTTTSSSTITTTTTSTSTTTTTTTSTSTTTTTLFPPEACPLNGAGGPNLMRLRFVGGGDLDIGWNGAGHNQGTLEGPELFVCLRDCDLDTDPSCVGTGPVGEGTINGESFGPPQAALVAGVPFCMASQLAEDIVLRELHLETGAIDLRVALSLRWYATSDEAHPCPTCTGPAVGAAGTCVGGLNDGQACVTEGVDATFGNTSSDCSPSVSGNKGTVNLIFDPLTSGTAELEGQFECAGGFCACPGQAQVNGCPAGTACTPADCPSDDVDAGTLPGIDQECCAVSPSSAIACFPSGLSRTGSTSVPGPPWPDPAYPKSSDVQLASSFCVPMAERPDVDIAVGLPGPAAVLLPADVHVESRLGPPPRPTTTTMFMTGVTGPARS